MSWITEVVLIFSSQELYNEDMGLLDPVEPLENINTWLKEQKHSKFKNISKKIITDGKAFCSPVYAGAFNFLKLKEFKKMVLNQKWQEPSAVLLIVKDEMEENFNVYKVPKTKKKKV